MALLPLFLIPRRRRAVAVRSEIVSSKVTVDPATEPEPAVVPVRTNPYLELEKALTIGQARLSFMRTLRRN